MCTIDNKNPKIVEMPKQNSYLSNIVNIVENFRKLKQNVKRRQSCQTLLELSKIVKL